MFRRINILPQWAVLFLDIFICIISLWIAYLVKGEFNFSYVSKTIFLKNALILVSICIPVFILLKTYAGIIRLTTIQDAINIFVAVTLINAGFIVVYLVASVFFHKSFISIGTLVICGLTEFVLLVFYRLVIKQFFLYFKKRKVEKKDIIIYGASEEGIITKRTYELDQKTRNSIVAFIDDDIAKTQKTIDGIKIFHSSEFLQIVKNRNVDELVIASINPSAEKKSEIVDICLDKGIKVMLTPPVKEWSKGQLSIRQIKDIRIEELLGKEPIPIHNEIIENDLRNKKILITGASGSIGSEIVNQLIHFKPAAIFLVDVNETALYESELACEKNPGDILFRYLIANVRDYDRMESIISECKPHYVYHVAAYKQVSLMEFQPHEAVAANVLGTKNMADLCLKYDVQKFIMISSDRSPNPTNVMAATKRIAEMYVHSLYNHLRKEADSDPGKTIGITKFITIRLGNVLASNGSVIPRFRTQIAQGGPVTVTHPDISRYFVTVTEACSLILEAGSIGKGGEVFVFNTGKLIRIVHLAYKMIMLSGLTPGIDIDIKFTGLRPGEKLNDDIVAIDGKTLPTGHDKIFLVKQEIHDHDSIKKDIDGLITLVRSHKNEIEIVMAIKKMVPEYLSSNSVYEKLDKMARTGLHHEN